MHDDIATPPTDAELASLAIFPLGGVTLFPGTIVPLHIFEPRYREMTADAIAHGRPIALALAVEGTPEGQPQRVHPVIGVGRLVHHEVHEDGRYDILLRGVGRARIVEELDPDTLYRQVSAVRLDDEVTPEDVARDRADTLRAMVLGLTPIHPRLAGVLSQQIEGATTPGALADALAPLVFPDARRRASIFVDTGVVSRLDATIERMGSLMAQAIDEADAKPN